jgi:hypothetical protein
MMRIIIKESLDEKVIDKLKILGQRVKISFIQ